MEASGDSEEDSAPAVDGSVLPSVEEKADADADDCESCIHDLHDSSYDEDDKYKYVDDDADVSADVTMIWQYAKVIEKEDTEKLVDADEEGKLFWETCLASGYP
uniref:Uncharacterized protein n=1 Tax=Ananas comosus var. bracteatus TaxID=296719 RepID=A0A6V7PFI6_ANACO|nr:unnamed protein product [Ananas comosus var. bracteatus]